MTQIFSVTITDEQSEILFVWGGDRFTSKSDILRALLHIALPDLPPDPPPHGGNRGSRPAPHTTIVLTQPWAGHRMGTTGVVEVRLRHGAMVAFGNETILIPYRIIGTLENP